MAEHDEQQTKELAQKVIERVSQATGMPLDNLQKERHSFFGFEGTGQEYTEKILGEHLNDTPEVLQSYAERYRPFYESISVKMKAGEDIRNSIEIIGYGILTEVFSLLSGKESPAEEASPVKPTPQPIPLKEDVPTTVPQEEEKPVMPTPTETPVAAPAVVSAPSVEPPQTQNAPGAQHIIEEVHHAEEAVNQAKQALEAATEVLKTAEEVATHALQQESLLSSQSPKEIIQYVSEKIGVSIDANNVLRNGMGLTPVQLLEDFMRRNATVSQEELQQLAAEYHTSYEALTAQHPTDDIAIGFKLMERGAEVLALLKKNAVDQAESLEV